MKKSLHWLLVIFIITAITITIGFVACKEEAAETTAAETTVGETTVAEETKPTGTLNAMGWKWSENDDILNMFAKFTEDTGIQVNCDIVAFENYYQLLTTRLSTPDLDINFAHGQPFMNPYVDAGNYISIDELGIDYSWLSPLAIEQNSRNRLMWMIAPAQHAMLLFVNSKIIKENGWDYPKSWEEFMALCQNMVEKGIKPLDVGFKFNNTRYIWFPLEATRISHDQPDFWKKANKGEFNPFADPRWVQIINDIVFMWENNYIDNELSPVGDEPIMQSEFANGITAMMFEGTWSVAPIEKLKAETGLEYKVIMVPANNKDFPTNVLPAISGGGFAVNKLTQKLELCKIFQQWWADAIKSGLIGEMWGWTPPAPGIPFKLFEDAGQSQIINEYYAAPTGKFTETQVPSIEIIDTIDKELQNVFTGQATVDQALKAMQDKWDAVMAAQK